MIKCQYAGDPNDEYCKNCNGITMLVSGEEYPCTECTAYSPLGGEEESTNEVLEDTKSEVEETAPAAENDVVEDEATNSTTEELESATDEANSDGARDNIDVIAHEVEKEETLLPDGVTVKSLRYMSGLTLTKTEPNGKETYYKFSAEEEWAVTEEVGSDSERMDEVREALWDKLNLEIDTQVEELYSPQVEA